MLSYLAAVSSAAALFSGVVVGDPFEARARAMVDTFTPAQLLGQMCQLTLGTVMNSTTRELNETLVRQYAKQYVGSYFNTYWDQGINGRYGYNASEFRALINRIQEITIEETNGHPIIFGIDSVHGAIYVEGAVMMPQQINYGASFNPDLVYKIGQITARDTEAAGISLIFGPILDISHSKLWARTYETFGEDPRLASVLGAAIVRGIQSYNQSSACLKHFIGYAKTSSGHDRDDVTMGDFELLNRFVPSFKAAIDAGALSVMESYSSINGEPVISSTKILTDLLRNDLGFNGMVVSDYNEVYNLFDYHRVVPSREKASEASLLHTSLDMNMVPLDTDFIQHGLKMLETYPEKEARLRESVVRIVTLKLKTGLYENPLPGADYVSLVGNGKDREIALEMARESIVLLMNNDSALPLKKKASVFLTGPSADNIGYQCGGWSLAWQGYSGNEMFPNGISVRQAFEKAGGNDSFTYFNGMFINGSVSDKDLATAVKHASAHEFTVVVIGETHYTEKPGDIDDLALPAGQVLYVEALAATGTKVITVYFGGRPRLLGSIVENSVAVINGMLPCELGGQALVEILYGDVNPSGKLPITYPKDSANIAIPYNHLVTTRCQYALCEPEWDFGAGLSYTQWNYSAVTLDRTIVSGADDTVTATVTVTNVGDRAGKETVMLFLIQPIQEISVPNVKMLKKFKKIELSAGESMDVAFTLSEEDWGVYKPQIGKGLLRIVEDTNYVVAIKPDTECNVYNGPLTNPLCAQFTINLSGTPVSSDALYSPVLINGGDSSQSTGAPVNGVDYFQSTGAPVNGVDYYKSTGAPVEMVTVHDLTLNSLDNSGAGNNEDVVQLQTSTGVVNTVQPQVGSD